MTDTTMKVTVEAWAPLSTVSRTTSKTGQLHLESILCSGKKNLALKFSFLMNTDEGNIRTSPSLRLRERCGTDGVLLVLIRQFYELFDAWPVARKPLPSVMVWARICDTLYVLLPKVSNRGQLFLFEQALHEQSMAKPRRNGARARLGISLYGSGSWGETEVGC